MKRNRDNQNSNKMEDLIKVTEEDSHKSGSPKSNNFLETFLFFYMIIAILEFIILTQIISKKKKFNLTIGIRF